MTIHAESEREFLSSVLLGNQPAVQFILQLFSLSQIMDDLIDQDKPRTTLDILRSYHIALIELPENNFYRAHFDYLRPQLALVLQAYADSVELEKGDDHHLHLAFVLRDRLTDIVTSCARLIGGWDHAQSVGKDIQLFFQDEPLSEFMAEKVEINQEQKTITIGGFDYPLSGFVKEVPL